MTARGMARPGEMRDCPAPAKLNLFLHVTGRRPDGYHLLQTVFQLLDVGDTLHFTLRGDGDIRRVTDVAGVPTETDLTVRAARLLQAAAGARLGRRIPGADIALDKRLPLGSGLGGGSSDAATTLLALNQLWQTGFSRAELMTLGLQLGADVPFFIFGRNAFAEGVGEVLETVFTPDCWYVIIEPGVSVPTGAIFAAGDLTRNSKPVKMTDFSTSVAAAGAFGRNDLQPVVCRLFPAVAAALKWLGNYGNARMTGSGACVFCPFRDESAADAVLKDVPVGWKAWKARAIARHPLAVLLG
ncbi:MAG: 4-(cytidine 5'-diphospho)-2-C-methyl-D-erythritol kinase [Burkholderiaceae bacterium]|nr:4-(cytidine 5'-diphospho)-2-C-methyl-D-erythritol kinase [Burkholderiaceae bacterium]